MAALIAVLALAFDVQFAQGSFTKKMMGISENLEKALSDVLETSDIKYTEPNVNATYVSTTEFYPKGMQHLYNLTTMFIDIIQKKQAYPEGNHFLNCFVTMLTLFNYYSLHFTKLRKNSKNDAGISQ